MTGSGSRTCIIWAADCICFGVFDVDFLGSLDVLSIGFGNENDLHGLMKLSAFSPICRLGGGWLHYVAFQGRRLDLSNLAFIMIDELRWGGWGMHCICFGAVRLLKIFPFSIETGRPSLLSCHCVCSRHCGLSFLLQISSGCIHGVQTLLIGGVD